MAVATYHAINGKHAAGENLHDQLGLPPSDEFKGKAVDSISVGEEGVISVAYNEKVHGGGDNAARSILALRPVLASGSFSWQCELPAETGILAEYAPAGCAAKTAPGS
ncbi:pilin [Chromobacterium sp. IIBBL 290-4]|nr:pilin [Chromobacterium sp. IIBBL 290-4]